MKKIKFLFSFALVLALLCSGSFASAAGEKKVDYKNNSQRMETYRGVVTAIDGNNLTITTKVRTEESFGIKTPKDKGVKRTKTAKLADVSITVDTSHSQFHLNKSKDTNTESKTIASKKNTKSENPNISEIKVGDSVNIRGIKDSNGVIKAEQIRMVSIKILGENKNIKQDKNEKSKTKLDKNPKQ